MEIRKMIGVLCLSVVAPALQAAVQTKTVEYKAGDTTLKGVLAWDDAQPEKRPGIIVAPEWWGVTDYPKKRAEMLAGLSYVGFAIDMHGNGESTDDPKMAGKWMGEVFGDAGLGTARLAAAVQTLQAQPQVDPQQLAAIGYCFGGTCVLNMARMNLPLKGVVSFHGGLGNVYKLEPQTIQPKVLVLHGIDDSFEPPEQIKGFMDEMKKEKTDLQFVGYSDTVHAFTNPESDHRNMAGVKYNAQSDKRSWQAMKNFLDELFAK